MMYDAMAHFRKVANLPTTVLGSTKAIKGRLVPPTRQAVRCSSQGVSMHDFQWRIGAGECTVLQGPASQCSNMALEEHS